MYFFLFRSDFIWPFLSLLSHSVSSLQLPLLLYLGVCLMLQRYKVPLTKGKYEKLPNLFKNSSVLWGFCFRTGGLMRCECASSERDPEPPYFGGKWQRPGPWGWVLWVLPLCAQLQTSSGKKHSRDSISKFNYVTSSKIHRVAPALPCYVSFHVLGRKGKRIANYLEWFILQQRMEIKSLWEFGTGRTEDAKAAEKQLWSLVYFDSKPVRNGYCHLCHYFCCLQGKNRLGPESSLSCPTLRAWGVLQEQGLPLLPPLCHPQLLFHTTLLLLLPFLEGKGNCWRILKGHRTVFACAWRIAGERHRTAFLVLFPVPKRAMQMGVFVLLSISVNVGFERKTCASGLLVNTLHSA